MPQTRKTGTTKSEDSGMEVSQTRKTGATKNEDSGTKESETGRCDYKFRQLKTPESSV